MLFRSAGVAVRWRDPVTGCGAVGWGWRGGVEPRSQPRGERGRRKEGRGFMSSSLLRLDFVGNRMRIRSIDGTFLWAMLLRSDFVRLAGSTPLLSMVVYWYFACGRRDSSASKAPTDRSQRCYPWDSMLVNCVPKFRSPYRW